MKIKLLIIFSVFSFCSISFASNAQLENPMGFNYTKDFERATMKPITRLRISDVELATSAGLFTLGLVLPYIVKENRQGAEIPCFVLSAVLFTEGLRLRSNVKNRRYVRYWARRKIPASKY